MRKNFLLLCLLLSNLLLLAQPKQYVTWSFTQKRISADQFELTFTANIAPTWHLYSQIETPDGPLPTVFEFEPSSDYQLIGKTSEPKPKEEKEPQFDNLVVRFFENKAVFKQKIKALSKKPFVVKGLIYGMCCNESMCQKFSPTPEFSFSVEGATVENITPPADTITQKDTVPASHVIAPVNSNTTAASTAASTLTSEPVKNNSSNLTYLALFLAGFLGGLAALGTPCVFPMIPMTVSFFTKQSKSKAAGIRNAFIYAFSIIAIYIALGLGVTLIFGADAMNNLATNAWFNLAFFVLLVVFAISFLGAFEITLPSSFINKIDAQSDRGGLLGIFFMAFTLSLVSFSCTGPIIGTLLVQAAATGAIAGPFFGMLGFSVALALPFGLFAAFPGWLNTLPKSGGWLNSVKVFLGFLELALAMKFLSNADMVYDAMIITREVFIAVWIVIFGLLGAYLMGWFRLPHDSELKFISVPRFLLAVIIFCFTFYLVPGLWGAPLKIINGFPPPLEYNESPEWFNRTSGVTTTSATASSSLAEHMHSGPNGIPAFDDYYLALEHAKKVNKPVMIDFTGKACINCRKMEAEVWSDPEVKRKLSEDFVLVSLYVDKKNSLPDSLQKEVDWNGLKRTLKSVGDRWSFLQNTKYASSTQPQYWIIDGNENRLSDSTSYDPDIRKYVEWLNRGLLKFKNNHP